VLDGDDGLSGEVLNQLNLLVTERAHLQAVHYNHTKHCIFLEQRDREQSPQAIFRIEGRQWFILVGARLCFDISNMNYMFGPDYSCNCSQSVKTICARVQLSHRSNQLGRLIVSCDRTKQVTIT